MAELTHPIYTLIPQRSWKAIVKRRAPTLVTVLAAFAVDPDEAADVRESKVRLDVGLGSFMSDGRITAALQTISQWLRQQKSFSDGIRAITKYDRRLGTWCVCQLSRKVTKLVGEDSEPSLLATIGVAEAWVLGNAKLGQAELAASQGDLFARTFRSGAEYPYNVEYPGAHEAARAAAMCAAVAEAYWDRSSSISADSRAAEAVGEVVDALREFHAEGTNDFTYARIDDFVRGVLADACLTFPIRAASGAVADHGDRRGSVMMPAIAGAALGAGAVLLAKRM